MKKILIVNDSIDEILYLRRLLAEDYEVLSADTGEGALSALHECGDYIEAAIIDAYLGDGTGAFSLLSDIRSSKTIGALPVIMGVRQSDEETSAKAIEYGASEGIIKPYNSVVVRQRVKNVLMAYQAKAAASKSYEELALANSLIEDSMTAVYVCCTKTYEMLYVNENCARICGKTVEEAKGQTCYAFLKGRTAPCENCHINKASAADFTVQEYFSEASGRTYISRCKLIDWGGTPAMVEYLLDETERINAHRQLQEMVNKIPSGIGIYTLFPDNRIELSYLNDGYYSLLGTTRESRLQYQGSSFIKAVHPDDLHAVRQAVSSLLENKKAASVEFRAKNDMGGYTWLSISCTMNYKPGEESVIYASYTNIDKEKKTKMQLEATKRVLELANQEGKISLWLYNIDKKRITRDFLKSSALGMPEVLENVPESMMDTKMIIPGDRQILVDAYREILDGADRSDCYVRMLNLHTNMYGWQHVTVTRFEDDYYSDRMAFGTTTDVNDEYETRLRFEREEEMRKQLFDGAIVYYELNLSKGTFEEYKSKTGIRANIEVNTPVNEKTRAELLEMVYEEDREKVYNSIFFEALLRKFEEGEQNSECVYRQIMPDGSSHWVRGVATIIKHPDTGEVIAFIYINDIDRETNDQKALGSIIDEEIDSAYLINTRKGIIHNIRDHVRLYEDDRRDDYKYADVVKQVTNYVVDGDRAACARFFKLSNLIKETGKNGRTGIIFRTKRKDGSVTRKSVMAFFLDETKTNIVMTLRDITALYDEEQRQKKALQNALDAANEASAAKSDFLARMSHDMRTPLNAVIGLTAIAQKEENSERTSECLAEIDSSSHFLLELINDILDFGRIERGSVSLKMEAYSLDEFKKSIDTVIRPLMDRKGLNFTTNLDCGVDIIVVDKLRFCQIFFNLLTNASKFTQPGGTVEFTAERIGENKQGKHGLKFQVRDNGRGMSREFMKKLFQPFMQENTISSSGTGLGLAIVQRLVDAFGGKVSARSVLGEGTEFTVCLYVDIGSADNASQEDEKCDFSALEGKRILLVDDNMVNILVAKTLLEKVGCVVDTAINGLQSVNAFAASEIGCYDAVLMDMRMPVMDGLTAAKELRTLKRTDAEAIPIVALTANAYDSDREAALNAGMNAFLAKPIEPKVMYNTLIMQIQS